MSGFKAKDRNLEESVWEIRNNNFQDQSQKKYWRKTDNHNILERGLKYKINSCNYLKIGLILTICYKQKIPLPSQNVQVLILGMYEYVTLHGKKIFADVIQSRNLKWQDFSGLSWWVQFNDKGPWGRQKKRVRGRCDYRVVTEMQYCCFRR